MNTKRELEIIELLKSIDKNIKKLNNEIVDIEYKLYRNNKYKDEDMLWKAKNIGK